MSNDVRVRITGDATGVKQATREASQSLAGLADNAKSLIAPLSSLFAGVSVGAFAAKLVQTQREFDVLNASLVTVTGSSGAAAREFAWIKQFAAETPYSLNQVTQSFIKMKAMGLDASEAALRSYGNTASAMGKDLGQMIEAVADAATGEFERLKEFGIKAKQQGDRVSLTFQGVTKTVGNNAAEIIKYLQDIGNNEFASAMAERAKTLDGAISNLGDTWDGLFRTINDNNAGGLIYDSVTVASGALRDAIDVLDGMSIAAESNARQTGAMATVQEGIATIFETVAVLGVNVAYVLKAVGNEIGGLAAQAAAVSRLDFSAAADIGRMMKEDADAARAAVDAQSEAILSARANADEFRRLVKEAGGATMTADYVSAVERLIEMQASGRISAKAFHDALNAIQPAAKGASGALSGASGAADETSKAAKKAAEAIARQIKALEDQAATYGLSEKSVALYKLAQDGATAAQLAHAETVLDEIAALKERNDLSKAYAQNVAAMLDPLEKQARALEDELETYGLTEAQIQQTIIARIEEARAIAATNGASEDHLRYLDREIEARKRIATAADGLDVRRANADAAREAEESWRRTADAIEDALIDALMEGGKSGAEYIEGLFRTMVLRPIVQAIVQPVAGGITSALGFGQPGASGGASGGGLNLPGVGNMGLLSSGVQMLGGALGSTAISSFGAGLGMTGAQVSGLAGAGLVNGTAAGLGSMVGAALPWIGAGLALASVFGLFDKKPSDKSAWATANPTTGAVVDVGSMTGKKDPGQEARDATAQLAQYLSAFAKDAGINRNMTVITGARDGFRVDLAEGWASPTAPVANGGWGRNFGAVGEDAMKRILNDLVDEGTLPKATIDAWRQMRTDAQGAARDAQEQIDVLDLLTQGINKAEIERANTMQQAGETLAAAYARMVAVENSIRAAIAQTFDSPAERLAAAFKEMGKAIPQTLDEYERLVRAQDLTTEAGRNQAVALLNVKGLWDEVQQAQVQAAEEAARAAEKALSVWARLRDDLTAFRADLTAGDLAGLSPEAAYRAAQTQFADTSRLAGLGNQDALAQLADVGRALLEASRAYNASTGAYFADRDRVLGAVDSGLALTGRKIEGFASGGTFGGGLRIVGERGPELEATGPARIWNAQQTQAMLGGGAEVVRELQAVVRVLSTGLSSMDRRLANLERSSDEQARVARLAADRRAA